MSTETWKPILNNGRDASIGAALVRLARQAEALHRYHVAAAFSSGSAGPASPDAAMEPAARPQVRPPRPAHTEVGS